MPLSIQNKPPPKPNKKNQLQVSKTLDQKVKKIQKMKAHLTLNPKTPKA